MESKNKRSTVYLDAELHKALKIKSAQIEKTMSELINDRVRNGLTEDYEALLAIEERRHEPNLDFKDILRDLMDSDKL